MFRTFCIILTALLGLLSSASAQTFPGSTVVESGAMIQSAAASLAAAAEQEKPWYVEVNASTYRVSGVGRTSTGTIYVERKLNEKWSAFALGYRDQEFGEGQIGLARNIESEQFGLVQVALGVGQASYDGTHRLVVPAWLYWQKDHVGEAILLAEKYRGDPGVFVKAYAYANVAGPVSLGMYCERWVICGPSVKVKFSENLSISFTGAGGRRDESPADHRLAVTLSF